MLFLSVSVNGLSYLERVFLLVYMGLAKLIDYVSMFKQLLMVQKSRWTGQVEDIVMNITWGWRYTFAKTAQVFCL